MTDREKENLVIDLWLGAMVMLGVVSFWLGSFYSGAGLIFAALMAAWIRKTRVK